MDDILLFWLFLGYKCFMFIRYKSQLFGIEIDRVLLQPSQYMKAAVFRSEHEIADAKI